MNCTRLCISMFFLVACGGDESSSVADVQPDIGSDVHAVDTTIDNDVADLASDDSAAGDVANDLGSQPQTCAVLGCSDLNRTCLEGQREGDGARCGACAEGFREDEGLCVRVQCDGAEDCFAPTPGPWSGCERTDDSCSGAGERRRNVATPACDDGVCRLDTSEATEACTADVDGLPCDAGQGRVGVCTVAGACTIPADAPLVEVIAGDIGVVTLRIISPTATETLNIHRDGELVATVTPDPSGQTVWRDTTAAVGNVPPGAPTDLVATPVEAGLELRWTPPSLPIGPAYTYIVRAVVDGVEGNASTPDIAAASGPEPDAVRVVVGSEARPVVAPTQPYLIPWEALSPGRYEPVTATAGTPASEAWVSLRVTAWTAVNGPETTISVQLENTVGQGAAASTTAAAIPGTPHVQWQRGTTGTPEAMADVVGLTGAEARDSDAPADGTLRHYRAVLTHPAATPSTSAIVSGRRSVPSWGQTCTSTTVCGAAGALGWCPTNTAQRRCAPRPLLAGGVQVPFQYVPAGTFSMGSPASEVGRDTNEDQHTVELTRPFAIARTELTLGEWRALTGGVDPDFKASDCTEASCPATGISWYSAVQAANALSAAAGLPACYQGFETCDRATWITGRQECDPTGLSLTAANVYACPGYRLCTEAEWEYAARAGVTTATHGGNLTDGTTQCYASAVIDPWEWNCSNAEGRLRTVGGKLPNAWGLYDALGNAREWAWDTMQNQLGILGVRDPFGTPRFGSASASRVVRGGLLTSRTTYMRFAFRQSLNPTNNDTLVGVRLCRTMPVP